MGVRRVELGEEEMLRAVRLEALADTPNAFGSTLSEELPWTAADWREWISDGATFVFEDADGPKGIVAGSPHTTEPGTLFLLSMWVHSSVRGTGAGDALVAALMEWAAAEGFRDVVLHVIKDEPRARRFYERNGFRVTGVEELRPRDGAVELEMRRTP